MSTTPPTNEPDDEQHSIVEEEYPVDRLRTRLNESLAGRPLTVYLVLFAGAATLLSSGIYPRPLTVLTTFAGGALWWIMGWYGIAAVID